MNNKDDKFMKMIEEKQWLKYILRIVVLFLITHIAGQVMGLADGSYGDLDLLEVMMYTLLTLLASFLLVNTDKL